MTARRRLILWCVVMSVGVAVLATAGSRIIMRSYLAQGMDRANSTLRLTVDGLAGHLRRYEALPQILADDDDVREFVTSPQDTQSLNGWLKETNTVLQSSDIYVIDANGSTIAASNYDRPDSFIGEDFSYRPYYTEAIAGRNASFYALGTTSGVRGYYYSAPILDLEGRIAGVIVFKIGLDAIEQSWRGGEVGIFVTDPEGIVFMASDHALQYAATLPMQGERLERTTASRRYSDATLGELTYRRSSEFGLPMIHIDDTEYLEATQQMPDADWTIHALLDTGPLRRQAQLALLSGVLLLCVAGMVTGLVLQRRAQLADRIALQAQARIDLEHRVEERTAALARVNARIETEVAERRLAEKELRRTQADLVQAGKLAALGQMSAALSHEINQPLAAARNYADSAAILIARGDIDRASDNIEQIVMLIDRMAAIGQHLRNVARRPNRKLDDLSLAAAVAEAVQIAGPRLAAAGAVVKVALEYLPPVRGAAVGLQQVLVNLLTNAADAVETGTDRRIEITADVGTAVTLRVRDHGPGIPAAIADRVFDPFFSTKQGTGLGLGLSISYNIMKDFGGELHASNHEGGGAVMSVTLQRATKRIAAE